MIYLDNGATTYPKPPSVGQAVAYAMAHYSSPGRGGHKLAMAGAEAVYDCRVQVAELFDTTPGQVVFTSNATHSLNIAIASLVQPGDKVVVSGFEHNSVMRALHGRRANIMVAGKILFDWENTIEAFAEAVTEDIKAVICTHVSNVFGYILPMDAIAQICRQRNVPLIVDCAQSAGVLPISWAKWDATFVAMAGHKGLYGPQGTGILLCGNQWLPFLRGGTGSESKEMEMPRFLPDGLEAGTPNVPGICGLGAGISHLRQIGLETPYMREEKLIQYAIARLSQREDVTVYYGEHQAGVLSMTFSHQDCEAVADILSREGIATRAGFHCAPLAHKSAGTYDVGTLRISPGIYNTMGDIDRFVQALSLAATL